MRTPTLQTIVLAVALALPGGRALASFHDSPVRLEVKTEGGDSHDRIKGSTAVNHDQKKVLVISVSSVSKTVPAGLELKWYMFGRDLKSDRVTVVRTGEAKVALASNGSQIITTPEIEQESTPEHSVVSRGRGGAAGSGGGRSRVSVKKVEATGEKYIGYGVQVLSGGKVVAETFDPAGLKTNLTPKAN